MSKEAAANNADITMYKVELKQVKGEKSPKRHGREKKNFCLLLR